MESAEVYCMCSQVLMIRLCCIPVMESRDPLLRVSVSKVSGLGHNLFSRDFEHRKEMA